MVVGCFRAPNNTFVHNSSLSEGNHRPGGVALWSLPAAGFWWFPVGIADNLHPHAMSSGDTHHDCCSFKHSSTLLCPGMGHYIKIATYPPAKLGVLENLSLSSMILAAIDPNWSEFFHCHLSCGTWTSCHSCSAPFHCVPGNMQRTLGGLGFISPRSRGLYIEGN
jgi:hypothetical protein